MLKRSVADRKMAALVKGRDLYLGRRHDGRPETVTDSFTLSPFDFFVLQTRTRFPFRYGIASMTDVPHLFVRTRVTSGTKSVSGLTAEGLPPKWFTKNPATTFDQDLPEMLEAIGHATHLAEQIAQRPVSFFDFSRELDRQQSGWAESRTLAPLLAHLGVSLAERAVLDGLCRLDGQPLHRMMAADRLGLRLGGSLSGARRCSTSRCVARNASRRVLRAAYRRPGGRAVPGDLQPEDRVDDGLPQDLRACIRAYGLRYFKVKLSAVAERDFPRLRTLASLLERETGGEFFITLDGNENFDDFGAFREFWQQAVSEPALHQLWRRIVVVEQPVHRDRALRDDVGAGLRSWPDRPPTHHR